MATRSIFDCDSYDAPEQPSERQLIAYDEDLLTFDTNTGNDEIDGSAKNVSISVKIENNGKRQFGKRRSNYTENDRVSKKPKKDVAQNQVSSNDNSQQMTENHTQSEYYILEDLIGHGTYGQVFKARFKSGLKSDDIAVKRLTCKIEGPKSAKMVEFMRREYDHLIEMDGCPYIVQMLKGCERKISKTELQLDLLFEYCRFNLQKIVEDTRITFTLSDVKTIMRQMLYGLEHIHSKSIMHRDFKTENILLTSDGIVKIADFGLSRKLADPDGVLKQENFTPNMCTQWYRAPEILLGDRHYNSSIDMWSIACILGEFWQRHPILRGENELHQIKVISQMCGSLTPETWPNIVNLRFYQKIQNLPNNIRRARSFLKNKVPFVEDNHANDFFDKMLQCDPDKRLTARQALSNSFFFKDPLPFQSLHKFMERNNILKFAK